MGSKLWHIWKKIVPLNVSPKCFHFAYPAVNPVTQSFVIIKAGIFPKSYKSCKQPFANNDISLTVSEAVKSR